MRQRARQAINPYHQQGVVLPYPVQCSCKVRALPIRAARLILEDHRAPLRTQRILLGSSVLFIGRNPGVADQSHLSHIIEWRHLNGRSEEHTSELQSLMRISYAVFCLKKKKRNNFNPNKNSTQYM